MSLTGEAEVSTTGKASTLHLIDASIYIFRAYFSWPDRWHSRDGYSINAIAGYTHFLVQLLERDDVTAVVAAFDESLGSCFRNQIYPDYKASRVLPDEALAYQLDGCRHITAALGIAQQACSQFEADDIIASYCALARRQGWRSVVVSRDKDLGQLLDADTVLWDFADDKVYDAPAIAKRFGVEARQIADYLALVGDAVDDIPGVPGVGPKTAAQLLQHFTSVEALLDEPEMIAELPLRGAGRLAEKLLQHAGQISVAKSLATLVDDVPLENDATDLPWQGVDQDLLDQLLGEWQFSKALTGRLLALADR